MSLEALPCGWWRAERTRPPRHRFALGATAAGAVTCLNAALAWDRLLDTLGLGPENG